VEIFGPIRGHLCIWNYSLCPEEPVPWGLAAEWRKDYELSTAESDDYQRTDGRRIYEHTRDYRQG
jgi:hypothetical protein